MLLTALLLSGAADTCTVQLCYTASEQQHSPFFPLSAAMLFCTLFLRLPQQYHQVGKGQAQQQDYFKPRVTSAPLSCSSSDAADCAGRCPGTQR